MMMMTMRVSWPPGPRVARYRRFLVLGTVRDGMKGWLGGWSDMPTVWMCVVSLSLSFSIDLSWRVVVVGLAVGRD